MGRSWDKLNPGLPPKATQIACGFLMPMSMMISPPLSMAFILSKELLPIDRMKVSIYICRPWKNYKGSVSKRSCPLENVDGDMRYAFWRRESRSESLFSIRALTLITEIVTYSIRLRNWLERLRILRNLNAESSVPTKPRKEATFISFTLTIP